MKIVIEKQQLATKGNSDSKKQVVKIKTKKKVSTHEKVSLPKIITLKP